MSNPNREKFKDAMRSMVAGRGDGIDINTPHHWAIECTVEPSKFFSGLPTLLPANSILYFEGGSIAKEVAVFYEANRASKPVGVIRDTIFPIPDIYHVACSSAVVARLCEFAANRPNEELCDHVKGYCGESLLFAFHDAFAGWLLISENVAEPTVIEFCRNVGVAYKREQTKPRDPEPLRRLLWAIENPDKVRIVGEPWWRWLLRRCIGR